MGEDRRPDASLAQKESHPTGGRGYRPSSGPGSGQLK